MVISTYQARQVQRACYSTQAVVIALVAAAQGDMAQQNGYYVDTRTTPTVSPATLLSRNNSTTTSGSSSPTDKHFVVAAIDFGTTYSGYAFSFTRDQDSIHMMRKWEGGDPGVSNQKTPTTLLLKPNGEFHSFGFGARDYYHDLEEIEARRWYYFEKFKMSLHSSQVSRIILLYV